MDGFARLLRKFKILFARQKFNHELEEEMAFHREQAEKDFQAEGVEREEASYAARRQFGNDMKLKEQSLEIVGFRFESVLQDLRFAVRQLGRNPGFTCTAILVLMLGIGATVGIFAYVDAALIKPLPYDNPSRLVALFESVPLIPHADLSYPDYLDWKKSNQVFSSFDVWTSSSYLLRSSSGTEPIMGVRVSAGFFRTLGVTPVLGRDFNAEEDSPKGARVVILTYGAWQQRYGGRKDVIGQTIPLDNVPYTIIGVLPPAFHFALGGGAEVWTTLHDPNFCEQRRSCHNLFGVARLKDGVSVQAALANMQSIAAQLEKEYPESNRGQGAAVVSLSDAILGDIRPILLVLVSGAGLLLLIAAVNVASLLLVRSEGRRREVALRRALGASSGRLLRQFMTESVVLVAIAGVAGVGAAYWIVQLLLKLIPADMLASMPYLQSLGLNIRVVGVAVLVSLLAAALFSIAPALRLSAADLRDELAEGSRTSSSLVWRRFGGNLVAVELAVATVLLAGAGLMGKSLYHLLHVDMGFQPDHLAVVEMAAPGSSYKTDAQQVELGRKIVERIKALPGVKSAAIATDLPISHNGNSSWIRIAGKPYNGEHNEVNERRVSRDYFTTLQTKLLRGRYFTDADDALKPQAVIINQTLAKRYFPGEDPIGQKIGDTQLSPASMRQIIGVVDDIREGGLDAEIWPAIYEDFNQGPDTYFGVVARTSQSAESLLPSLTAAIHQVDAGIGTVNPETMERRINESPAAWLQRSSAWLVGGFACMALLLGVVGLYGVIAYSVSKRTREIGVRMALGARRGLVYSLILKEAGWLVAIGLVAGLVCSIATTNLMRQLLFGVSSWDASTLAGVAIVLALSALLASYIPARRAASVNPVEALRAE
jgi:predicted permease